MTTRKQLKAKEKTEDELKAEAEAAKEAYRNLFEQARKEVAAAFPDASKKEINKLAKQKILDQQRAEHEAEVAAREQRARLFVESREELISWVEANPEDPVYFKLGGAYGFPNHQVNKLGIYSEVGVAVSDQFTELTDIDVIYFHFASVFPTPSLSVPGMKFDLDEIKREYLAKRRLVDNPLVWICFLSMAEEDLVRFVQEEMRKHFVDAKMRVIGAAGAYDVLMPAAVFDWIRNFCRKFKLAVLKDLVLEELKRREELKDFKSRDHGLDSMTAPAHIIKEAIQKVLGFPATIGIKALRDRTPTPLFQVFFYIDRDFNPMPNTKTYVEYENCEEDEHLCLCKHDKGSGALFDFEAKEWWVQVPVPVPEV